MNVLFDHQVFSFQEYGGISRYYSRLITTLSAGNDVQVDLLIKYSNNSFLTELASLKPRSFFRSHKFKGRNEIIRILNQQYFRKEYYKRTQPDIFHPTYYHPYFLESIGTVPFALTIYDMAHEMYPTMFHPMDFTIKNKRLLAAKASRIIAISEHTKKDAVRILGVPESKIDVIPLATDLRVDFTEKNQATIPEQFILYVGARNTYKNFPFFLRSITPLINDEKKLFVVCAGGGKFSTEEKKIINELSLSDKIIQMNVNDGILALLYSKTKAMVYPSLYEGFGIPVLEAFTCGAPVVLSERSSLPEVGGDAAVYFDPEQDESLLAAVRSVVHKQEIAREMVKKGLERAKLFSWGKTADATLATYRKILHR